MSLFGLFLALFLLIFLAFKGHSVIIIAPIVALVAVVFSAGGDAHLMANYTETYGVKGGAPFGVGAPVYGLEASVLGSLTDYVDGIQTSLIMTKGKEVNGLQFSLVNMVERLVGLQLGIVNLADDATFQLGILNYNENGILPLLPVLNFNF